MTKLKILKPGAVAELREIYYQRREETLASVRKKIEGETKDKPQTEKKTKKVAKPARDLESP
jgi:hypothetical protein